MHQPKCSMLVSMPSTLHQTMPTISYKMRISTPTFATRFTSTKTQATSRLSSWACAGVRPRCEHLVRIAKENSVKRFHSCIVFTDDEGNSGRCLGCLYQSQSCSFPTLSSKQKKKNTKQESNTNLPAATETQNNNEDILDEGYYHGNATEDTTTPIAQPTAQLKRKRSSLDATQRKRPNDGHDQQVKLQVHYSHEFKFLNTLYIKNKKVDLDLIKSRLEDLPNVGYHTGPPYVFAEQGGHIVVKEQADLGTHLDTVVDTTNRLKSIRWSQWRLKTILRVFRTISSLFSQLAPKRKRKRTSTVDKQCKRWLNKLDDQVEIQVHQAASPRSHSYCTSKSTFCS